MLKLLNCAILTFLSHNTRSSNIFHGYEYSNEPQPRQYSLVHTSHQSNENKQWLGTGGYKELRANHPQFRTTEYAENDISPQRKVSNNLIIKFLVNFKSGDMKDRHISFKVCDY